LLGAGGKKRQEIDKEENYKASYYIPYLSVQACLEKRQKFSRSLVVKKFLYLAY
jgi:hypothetical protein